MILRKTKQQINYWSHLSSVNYLPMLFYFKPIWAVTYKANNLRLYVGLFITNLENRSSDLLHTRHACRCGRTEVQRRVWCNSDMWHILYFSQALMLNLSTSCSPANLPNCFILISRTARRTLWLTCLMNTSPSSLLCWSGLREVHAFRFYLVDSFGSLEIRKIRKKARRLTSFI